MFNHAIHLCQQFDNCDDILFQIALKSTIPQRLASAMHFFHKKICLEKAAVLFMKAGDRENARKALLEIQLDQNNCHHISEFIYDLRDELPLEKALECTVLLMKTGCLEKSSKIIESMKCSVVDTLEYFSVTSHLPYIYSTNFYAIFPQYLLKKM